MEKVKDLQLHPERGSLSFPELHQFLTQTFNESFLLLCLQDQQQGHNAVHHALYICRDIHIEGRKDKQNVIHGTGIVVNDI